MRRPSDLPDSTNFTRELLIGLGESSVRKSYFPELQERMAELERFRALLDKALDAIFLVDASTGQIVDANAAARNCNPDRPETLIGSQVRDWVEFSGGSGYFFEEAGAEKLKSSSDGFLHFHDGRTVPVELSVSTVRQNGGAFLVIVARDVTDRKQAEENLLASHEELHANFEELNSLYLQLTKTEEVLRENVAELEHSRTALAESESRYRLALEGANDAIWDWDMLRDCCSISKQWVGKLGLPGEVIPDPIAFWDARIHPEDLPARNRALAAHLAGETEEYETEVRLQVPPDRWLWISVRGKALFGKDGFPVRMAGSYTDITARKRQEERIHHLAYHDALTGLPNRASFKEALDNAVAAAADRGKHTGAVFLLDIDNFRLINDSWGYSSGDELLMEIAGRLRNMIFPQGFSARLGGDEFALLVDSAKMGEVPLWAERLLAAFDEPVYMRGAHLAVSCSVGVAIFNGDMPPDEILRNADLALNRAKEKGRKSWQLYRQEMTKSIMNRVKIESELHIALAASQLQLYYQPQVALSPGSVAGFEALLRWNHPADGMVLPQTFVPVAEETGLIIPIGDWVLREACRFGHLLGGSRGGGVVSVNVSARQLMKDDFVQRVSRILAAEKFPPDRMELEITETMLMESFEANIRKLRSLRELGLKVALDDFGTGYSSLTYLSRLPIDSLKIDKSFIDRVGTSKTETSIVGAIIQLAHQLSLTVVAEGVETNEQLRQLNDLNCDFAQGYLFSRPVPQGEALRIADTTR